MSTERYLFWFLFALIIVVALTIFIIVMGKHKNRKIRKLSKKESDDIVFADYEIRFIPIDGTKPHPAYVYFLGKDKAKGINTTHKRPKGKKAIKISHNPDPKDNGKTYAVKEIHVFDVAKSGRNMRRKGWYYSPEDVKKINAIIRKEDK